MAKIHIDLRRDGIVKMRFPANINWTRTASGAKVVAKDNSTKERKASAKAFLDQMNLVPRDVRNVADELDRIDSK